MIEIVDVDVTAIDPNPWNPNVQSDVVAKATAESLKHFGFVEPVLLRPKGDRFEIVNGEHRWKEATALGHETIPAVVRDLTDEEAKKLTVILNETTGDADLVLLGRLLTELQEQDDFRVALPYTDTELAHLLSFGADTWDDFGEDALPPPPVDDPATEDVALTLTLDQYDQFRVFVVILEKAMKLRGTSRVVFETVYNEAVYLSPE